MKPPFYGSAAVTEIDFLYETDTEECRDSRHRLSDRAKLDSGLPKIKAD
jgi:hypothetical protein